MDGACNCNVNTARCGASLDWSQNTATASKYDAGKRGAILPDDVAQVDGSVRSSVCHKPQRWSCWQTHRPRLMSACNCVIFVFGSLMRTY